MNADPLDLPNVINRLKREKQIAQSLARQWASEAERLELNIAALQEIVEAKHDR